MKPKTAARIRKSMKACKTCALSTFPSISTLTQDVDVVLWASKKAARTEALESFLRASRTDHFVGLDKTCPKHRRQIVKAFNVLFEIDFQPDGGIHEVVPVSLKGQGWFTLFLKDPMFIKKSEQAKWIRQGTNLGRMVRGADQLPKMPKRIRDMTDAAKRDQLEWELENYGYMRMHLKVVGEDVVVLRDRDTEVPKGYGSGVPRFTLDELTRMRHFVTMKPDPEMVRGVWLLKKHLGVSVIQ